jgi:hypothetical protein
VTRAAATGAPVPSKSETLTSAAAVLVE